MASKPVMHPVQIFSTCPPSSAVEPNRYLETVARVSRWSEEAGCTGMLVYTDNGIVDPWLVAQIVLQSTLALCPLVALQPVYMHPYTAAKMVSTLGFLHGRRIFLNMVAGGFKNDLAALDDSTPHDRRYDRLVEYATVMKLLLESDEGVSVDGEFYRVRHAKLAPPLPPELMPGLFISGSSAAGIAAARVIGATAVRYPEPADTCEQHALDSDLAVGVRVGIVARETEDEAWKAGHARFPGDRHGQIAHQLAMKVSDSVWHQRLSEVGDRTNETRTPYWLHPFQNYKTFCPYLVGSYETVAAELSRYVVSGHRTFILDVPQTADELKHIGMAFERATVLAEA